ncbi:MAG: hypothetical protein J5852_03220 [Clostridia bacterium]|nr:hypothetical protein [Clostridia bacterium]
MKKVLAVILCVCIALTLSVSVIAEESPQNTVIIRKGVGTKQDGTTIGQDTFVEVASDDSVTVKANEKTYGTFNKWSIFVVGEDGEYTEAEEGTDFEIVDGDLESEEITVKPIGGSKIAIAGNYNEKDTAPEKESGGEQTADVEDAIEVERNDDGITVKPDDEKGEFKGWKVTVVDEDGNVVEAEEGVDYIIVDGSLDDETVTIKPINAITISGDYKSGEGTGEEEEPEEEDTAKVMVRKAKSSIGENTYVAVAVGDEVTVEAADKYGKFDSWSVYVISDTADLAANGSVVTGAAKILNLAATQKVTAAKAGKDYEVVDGSLTSEKLVVKVLKDEKIVICGNYDGTTTDPLTGKTVKADDGKSETSPKTSDVNVIYAAFALLAAGAIVFGVKKQLSK